MKIYRWSLATLFALAISLTSLQANTDRFSDRTGLMIQAHGGVELVSGLTNVSGNDAFISFDLAVNPIYYFHKNVGAFTGFELNRRGFDGLSGAPNPKVFYLDIPFGLSFATPGFLGDSGRSFFNLGGFLGIPFEDYDFDIVKLESKMLVGLYLRGGSMFEITRNFSLGFNSYLKFGLNDAVKGGDKQYAIDLGLGLSTGFGPITF